MNRLSGINRLISQPDGINRNKDCLIGEMKSFVDIYQNSLEISTEYEDIRPLLLALEIDLAMEVEIFLAKVVKILFRSPSNRKALGRSGMLSIVKCLERHNRCFRSLVTGEIGNVVLNACYNGENVDLFVEAGGVDPLCHLLVANDLSVAACVLGAIQGICYVPAGRFAIRKNLWVLQRATDYLTSLDEIVRARSVGFLHNLSADNVSIAFLRDVGCIPSLVNLLLDPSSEVCQAAAGTIQNLAREVAARELILSTNAVSLLADLLFSNDPKCQIASIGALLNLLGPSLDDESMNLLRETLTDGLVLGMIESSVFEPIR